MIGWLTSILISSYLLTFYVRKLAIKKKVVDFPNERSSHTVPTPRGGGLAIVISWFIGISILFFTDSLEDRLYYAFLPGILLATISLLDDIFEIKPVFRLITQFVSVSLALFFLGKINIVNLGIGFISTQYVLIPIALIGMIWFINLYNFLDGIDAYASVEAIFVAFSIFYFTRNNILLLLVFAVLGFLVWNWPKAKIFMGDVGSTQLGYILVVSGIYFHNQGVFSITNWIIITSLFWFDATLTLYRRWRNKEKLSEAHKKHAYQRIVQAGFSHQKTVLYSLGLNIVLFGFAYLASLFQTFYVLFFLVSIMLIYFIIRKIDSRKEFK